MPLNATITLERVQQFAPDEKTLERAKEIVRNQQLLQPGISSDGTWLIADGKGQGREPYQVSIDFIDPHNPLCRSTSPSRTEPDKFAIALLLSYLENPESFRTREPSDDLILKREKKLAQEQKQKGIFPTPGKKATKSAQEKRILAQREGLESLERQLIELVAGGQWFEAARLDKLDKLSKQLSESGLHMAMFGVRRLILLNKAKDLNEEERNHVASEIIAQLWVIIKKSRRYLDNRLDEGETQEQVDAISEDLLGKSWSLTELKDKGYFQSDLSLLELAYERMDDESRQQRLEISNLLDLKKGQIYQSIVYRAFKGISQIPEQLSYTTPIQVSEAAIYPGFVNRRIRWDRGIELPIEDSSIRYLENAYQLAQTDLMVSVEAFKDQLTNLLAPRELIAFVRCETIGMVRKKLVIEDAKGNRIEAVDRRKDYSHTSNLIRAAGMLGKDKPALVLRLFVQPIENKIAAVPLAAITPKHHLRLGI